MAEVEQRAALPLDKITYRVASLLKITSYISKTCLILNKYDIIFFLTNVKFNLGIMVMSKTIFFVVEFTI